jgi:succinate dehydrogenase / fumarate reductase membrane anchor subunit
MQKSSRHLTTKLAQVKGLGAAHHGVSHWWWQRVTAVALIPLSLWFVYSLMTAIQLSNAIRVSEWFASPVNAIAMVLFIAAVFYHAKLGVQVVIEDYVHAPFSKYLLLFLNLFFCVVMGAVSILAVLKLHFLDTAALT